MLRLEAHAGGLNANAGGTGTELAEEGPRNGVVRQEALRRQVKDEA